MEIGATKAVQDRLKTTKIEESKGASLVFCWDTHLTKIKGRNVLFIVNASNRYTIAMTDIEPRNWNYYTMYIRSVIHGVMQEMEYSEEQIGQYFKMSGDTTVTKTHGRKSVGGINRMVMDAQYFGKKLEKEAKYQWELSEYLNRDICQPEGFDAYGYPSELFNLYGIDKKRAIRCIPDIENYEYVPVNNSMLAKAEISLLIFERNRGKCFIEMY